MTDEINLDTSRIREWRSIATLIVFVATNIVVLRPSKTPIYIPRCVQHWVWKALGSLRIRNGYRLDSAVRASQPSGNSQSKKIGGLKSFMDRHFVRYSFPLDFTTAPLIADLVLLMTSTIGREEVYAGTVGTNNIYPLDIMAFFLTLAYIAISIDASGLIRYLAFRVLQWGGKNGHRLFFYLYLFFLATASCIGNDPVILSGTAFLAYMTRVSINIKRPQAWIYTQFCMANVGSAVLVSSNPTNLVLAGAFNIKFIHYTANMIVPVCVTALALFPFLRYIVFWHEDLVPSNIRMYEVPTDMGEPRNPNIRNAHLIEKKDECSQMGQTPTACLSEDYRLSLEEIMNPFLDKYGATAGATIMALTLITILALNAATEGSKERPVYWVTLPAAVIMLCWDLSLGWKDREKTRKIAKDVEEAERREAEENSNRAITSDRMEGLLGEDLPITYSHISAHTSEVDRKGAADGKQITKSGSDSDAFEVAAQSELNGKQTKSRKTLESLMKDGWKWSRATFPTVTAVLTHLPFKLIPFALCMFVLVQALSTKGWIAVFAYGWDHWVQRTGTIGAIGGMGFLSVIMCNFAGTNIGTTILLCRVIQGWDAISQSNHRIITEREFWATVYSMALGVNYGAFSTAFSASLAGLLWRDILERKKIFIEAMEFAKINFRIIAVAMSVGCAVLTGEIYLFRSKLPYVSSTETR